MGRRWLVGLVVLLLVAALFPGTASGQGAVKLTFWSWRVEDKWAYDRMIRVFQQKNPGITVEFIPFKQTEYNTILSSALTAGKGPDIIHLRAYGGLETFTAPGFIAPLDFETVPELRTFSRTILEGARGRKDGKIYGVPFASQTLVIYYNKKIFARHNLTVPRTWDEFLALMKTLKDQGVLPLANGGKDGWTLEVMAGVIAPNFYGGTAFFDAVTRGQTSFKDPAFTGALARLLELRPYMHPNFMGVDYATMQQLFINEQAAMFIGGSWEIGFFRAQNKNLEFDVFAAPPLKAGQTPWVSSFNDGNYGINAKTPYMEAALKFIRFTATREFGQMFTDLLAQNSAVPGVVIKDPVLKRVQELNRKATPYIMLVGFRWQAPTGSTLLQSGLQAMMAGTKTPEQVGEEVTRGLSVWFDPFRGR
ncbi:MAG: extracellular solute-binding protein [Armatimonadota bacterium]|nr:extracellular solute-binding protein [Armatimonadota bacterium]MDR7452112.1 extracellular solute-binding protein [Armatimonadota bacterium]MDR7467836.1 extracellular solute-binding protein [Armatimonadota bacterium]MDR7494724.1 extracellular solute-binding protein [Armatimonadota bacterium]MDR7499549.1 extracellular solute-binding protein [Armatimonadota bacterium]